MEIASLMYQFNLLHHLIKSSCFLRYLVYLNSEEKGSLAGTANHTSCRISHEGSRCTIGSDGCIREEMTLLYIGWRLILFCEYFCADCLPMAKEPFKLLILLRERVLCFGWTSPEEESLLSARSDVGYGKGTAKSLLDKIAKVEVRHKIPLCLGM
ncbi:hypothetical protein QL285_085752 [Trifolium repens]|nr:hypothetical protein QL285_085752 [Trifolium repens]